ncbi:MAG: hypothetical protein DLM61_25915 [Pseudonocardiales bacterium]|nr:MAG: hypothetical protein DLM61_25915 [Pseudonocardiales bacterium]
MEESRVLGKQLVHANHVKVLGHAQRFLSSFSGISPHFRPRRHRLTAAGWREEMNSDHALLTIDRDHTLRLPG